MTQPTLTPCEFAQKWGDNETKEKAAEEHFIDLCRMLGETTPNEADPTGEHYVREVGHQGEWGRRLCRRLEEGLLRGGQIAVRRAGTKDPCDRERRSCPAVSAGNVDGVSPRLTRRRGVCGLADFGSDQPYRRRPAPAGPRQSLGSFRRFAS